MENYYRKVRPFGFWGDLQHCLDDAQQRARRSENFYDLLSLPFAFFWQVSVLLIPLQIFIGTYKEAAITAGILILSLVGLYFFWYKKLPPAEA